MSKQYTRITVITPTTITTSVLGQSEATSISIFVRQSWPQTCRTITGNDVQHALLPREDVMQIGIQGQSLTIYYHITKSVWLEDTNLIG